MKNISNNTHKKLTLDRSIKDNTPKWVVPFLVGGWFVGLLVLYFLFNLTHISIWQTLKYLLAFSVIFTLVPYKWVVKLVPIDYPFVLILNFFALGPVFTSLFFIGNFLLASPPVTKTAKIIHYAHGEGFQSSSIVIKLEGNELQNTPKFRTFDASYYKEIAYNPYVEYSIAEGFFGYQILTHYDFITKPK